MYNHNQQLRRVARPLVAWSLLLAAWCATPAAFALDTGDIVVASTRGEVIITVRGAPTRLRAGSVLELPATLRTGRDGAVELRQGATSISVGPDTLLEFPALEKAGGPIDRVVQPRGNAFYSIGKRPGRKLRVETPFLVGVVKGTQFNVAAGDDATTISLFEGRLEILSADGSDSIDLLAGEIASRDRQATEISVLKMDATSPPAPSAPASPSGNSAPRPAAPVSVEGDAKYAGRVSVKPSPATSATSTGLATSLPTSIDLGRNEQGESPEGNGGSRDSNDGGSANGTGNESVDLGTDVGVGLGADNSGSGNNNADGNGSGNPGNGNVSVDLGTDVSVDLGNDNSGSGNNNAGVGVGAGVSVGVDLDDDPGSDNSGSANNNAGDGNGSGNAGNGNVSVDLGVDVDVDLGLDDQGSDNSGNGNNNADGNGNVDTVVDTVEDALNGLLNRPGKK
jgi:hypothetical protein